MDRLHPRRLLARLPLPVVWITRMAAIAAAFLTTTPPAQAATLPAGFSETQVASGLQSVTAMTIAPDGRIFVCEQVGRLRVIKNDALLGTPFLTVSVNSSGERGLLGVAFDPDFATNRFVYVYYTTSSSPVHNRVSRFTASATNPDVVQAGSELAILDLPNLSSATNHNGGAIHFGPDGKLYIVVGDNANSSNAPSLTTTLGKVLRINKDGTIPTDNPFFSQTTGNNRAIWARGLRNPFTFGFQPGTGRMHVNDVGQNTFEEVNLGTPGANYGWPATEGPNPPGQSGVTYPIHSYSTSAGSNCAVVGAAFYNPVTSTFPSTYTGRYFFGDFCGGFIRTLSPPNYTTSSGFATNVPFLVDLAVSPNGFLYYLARGQQGTGSNGQVWKVRGPVTCEVPTVTDQPDAVTVAPGQNATFSAIATGAQPLSYQWQRAEPGSGTFADVPGATAASVTVTAVSAADNGARYRVIVTNSCPGTATSSAATLTVTAAVPTATITQPTSGTLYRGGQTIAFAGTGTDPQGNPLPASAFTWEVNFHHADHVHPHMPATSGITSGSFTTSDRGHTETDVFYRVTLTVTSGAQTATASVDVQPRIVTLNLAANPATVEATLDGQPVSTPLTFSSVAGVFRTIGTSSPQIIGGATYTFDRWSDDGTMTHEIATPDVNTTYTAFFSSSSTCVTAPAGQAWQNRAFPSAQTGTFTARFDATPSISNIPGSTHVGFSLGAQTAYAGFATIIRFSSTGVIDARNGGAYGASSSVSYVGGVTYHFRVVVNVPAHTYSVFVTPDGGSELTVANNFAFRTEQNTVTSLTSWGVYTAGASGALSVCNFAFDGPPPVCVTANAGAGFQNRSFATQTGTFTAEFQATPTVGTINSTMGLSNGAQTVHTGFAAIARFNTSGTIDARNGGAYQADNVIPYSANVTYRFRLVINVATRTYSVFVTPSGGSELTVGTNYAFRSEQAGVTALNSWAVWDGGPTGSSNTVCGFTITPGNPPGPGGTPIAINGQLSVCGTKLCNQHGHPIQLRGMSTHGLQWYGRGTGTDNCVPDAALDALATDWEADIVRLSLYVQEGGYETDPARFTNEMHTLINEVTERGMYALVDWHMLDPGDPHDNLARATTFFTAMAQQHASKTNVIYEIANEPNGVTWARIKSYAEQIIPVIRQHDPDAVILVGTRAWSSLGMSDGATADEVINNPVNAANIMYTFHFYAASHGASYRNELARAADIIPMFVTEFGTQLFTGDGGNDFASAQAYLDMMRTKKISWTNWNFSHDFRSGAAFTTGSCPNGPFAGTSRLKAAGAWVRERIKSPPDDFPRP